jgi:DNA polymerase-3 subunit delta
MAARDAVSRRQKEISGAALGELVNRAGSNARQLENEVEKLCVFTGDRKKIELADVTTLCSHNKTAKAFALGDALGDRNLPALLKRLDESLWETKFDKDKSEIGLLYGLISKVRALLFLREMLREGWVKETHDYNSFKAQLSRVPADKLPTDRRFNPLALNPYVLYKGLPQARKYSSSELVQAMEVLLLCNQRLVSSGLDEALVLQQALVQIVTPQLAAV